MTRVEPLALPSLEEGRHLFLSGPMAVGKSTVGPLVAAELGWPFVDLDREIERAEKTSVAALFAERGEAAFRAIEAAALDRVAARTERTVVALGGGTVTTASARATVIEHGLVVTLLAAPGVSAARAGSDRPLLRGAPTIAERTAVLEGLFRARRVAYRECHAEIGIDDEDPQAVARAVLAVMASPPILVALGERSYRIGIGDAELDAVGAHVERSGARGKVLVVTDENVRAHAAPVVASLAAAELDPALVVLAPGEDHKTIRALEAIWDAAIAHGVDRHGAIVAVGGGVVGDVAGFAAATLARGVRWAQVPTTLLSMADASVGGKTAIDRPEGKNLVGAFHQPTYVAIAPRVLATLPVRDRRAGLAEVVKCAWLAGDGALRMLEADAEALARGDVAASTRAVRLAAFVKARVVGFDEREAHARLALNLGHTLGHALEAASGFSLLHGEAVALGLLAAHRLARALGAADAGDEARTARLLGALGLPTGAPSFSPGVLERFLGTDKKSAGGAIRFVVPLGPGRVGLARLGPSEVLRLST